MSPEVQNNTTEYIQTRMVWLKDAVELVTGDRETPIENVFEFPMQNPQERRADATPLELTADKEQELREIAGRFGIGGEADVTSIAEHQVLEGGKPWKVEAEAKISNGAQTIIFAGSTFRRIGVDESDYMRVKYGVELAGDTEYDMVRKIAEKQHGFVLADEEEVLPFGYEISEAHTFINKPTETEQLKKIGEVVELDENQEVRVRKPVLLLKVDGETYQDEEGKEKQRFRPDSAELMVFISQVLSAGGDEISRVALNTSTTYAARVIDTMRAGLQANRTFDVGMYGRWTLAEIRGEAAASPTEIQNIPGELRLAHYKLQQLQAELQQQARNNFKI